MEGSWSFKEGLLKDEERVLSLSGRPRQCAIDSEQRFISLLPQPDQKRREGNHSLICALQLNDWFAPPKLSIRSLQ